MKTRVKFLYNQANDDIFAYFPDEKIAYSHIGQHSDVHINYVNESMQATNEQFKPLRDELINLIGYDLSFESERLIKCPFFEGISPDLRPILKELNKDRETNGLNVHMDEEDLKFDSELWVRDYCASIGAKYVKNDGFDLWYIITLEGIQKLKKTKWDFDSVTDEKYITNYNELVELITDEDREEQADELKDNIAGELWRFNGSRHLGSDSWYFGGFTFIELNGGLLKYKITTSGTFEFHPAYVVSDEQRSILEGIRGQLLNQ